MWKLMIAALLVMTVGLCLLTPTTEALPHRIALDRRDGGDFDSLLSELKSKGSRMRFGKRSSVSSNSQPESNGLEYPNLYLPDRFMWLL
ncbi:hypothetical protein M3Y94_01132600 [Aphelenchoides besseyi]|nr:hypothetical protein M3Y94_01132600 [Aphelenchoides besseyi]